MRTASWREKTRVEKLKTVEPILQNLRRWAEQEVARRFLFCPLLYTMLPPTVVMEVKEYVVCWVVQAVVTDTLMMVSGPEAQRT